MTPRPPRRPRIGADSAHAWARNLSLGNPHAKQVLMALCFYVNDTGSCFCGLSTLAQDTELSEQTVRNRLRWLEEIGAVLRIPQWLDEHGRRTYDGRNREGQEGRRKRTSDEIKLLIEDDPEEIERRAWGQNDDGTKTASPPVSPMPQIGLNPEPETVSPTPALRQPYDSAYPLDSLNSELEDSPQSPPLGETASEAATEPEVPIEESDASLDEFKAAFPEPSTRPTQVIAAWRSLAPDEQRLRIRAAAGAREFRRLNPKRSLVDQIKFVRDRMLCEEFARFAPPERVKPVLLPPGSPEWAACDLMRQIAGEAPLDEYQTMRLMRAVPAGVEQLAAASRRAERIVVAKNSPQFNAWADRVREWTGYRPEPQRIYLDPSDAPVSDPALAARVMMGAGTTYQREVPHCVLGLLVPSEWPPAKGIRAGPPSDHLTESDIEELAKG